MLDTPLGRLTCLVGNDVNFFEHTRSLVLRGAEVVLHLTAETTAAAFPVWEEMRRARAYENVAYFASVNNGGYWVAALHVCARAATVKSSIMRERLWRRSTQPANRQSMRRYLCSACAIVGCKFA